MSALVLNVGDALPAHTFAPFTTRQLAQYAGASGDFNELHYDRDFAIEAGFERVVVHGLLSMALCTRYLEMQLARAGTIRECSARFRGVILVGDALTVVGHVVETTVSGLIFSLEGRRADGAMVLSGTATTT